VWSYARKGAICRVTQSKAGSTPTKAVSNWGQMALGVPVAGQVAGLAPR
jgi:hypothetical protein